MQHLTAMKYVENVLAIPGRLSQEPVPALESAARAIRIRYLTTEDANPRYFTYERLLGREIRSRRPLVR